MPKTLQNKVRLFVKRLLLRRKGVVIDHNCTFSGVNFAGRAHIEPYCRLIGDPEIIIGNNFYMNAGCHILGEIVIGNDVLIGPKTVIWGKSKGIRRGELIRKQPDIKRPIKIGNDVWIGANSTVLKGVCIGDRCSSRSWLCSYERYSGKRNCCRNSCKSGKVQGILRFFFSARYFMNKFWSCP